MMNMNKNLKKAGLKATLPRLRVMELFLNEAGTHFTAEDVYKRFLTEGDEIGLATIYRVLTQFEHAGLLQRHHFETGKAVFELNEGNHHDHLVCIECGKVEEFLDEGIEKRQKEIAAERGFAVQDHALYIYVDCLRENCPNRAAKLSHTKPL
ncbi:MAG: ferric iron uptake transcriptional regulator [Magnetococcales bacterium]|nr:ferric iron uptake transcriptional regulator [Magnetococcales bacterium]